MPTTSKTQLPFVVVVIWVSIHSLPAPPSSLLAVASGACWAAPVTETAPAMMFVIAPAVVIETVYDPVEGRLASSMYHSSTFMSVPVPTLRSTAFVRETPS